MKEYHADGWVCRLPLYIIAPFALIADYCSDAFPWAYLMYFTMLGAGCAFYLFTPYKYFPVFTSLVIDDKKIQKRLFEVYTTRSICRSKAKIGYVMLHGTLYAVFTEEDIPTKKRDILRLVHRRKALLYPWKYEMHLDFPDLFDDNAYGKSFFLS